MPLLTRRTPAETADLLRQAGIAYPDSLMKAATDEPGSEHHGHSGTTHIWVWYVRTRGNFDVDICHGHDTDYGCCDRCGRWRERD